jgi:hypothetical protein
MNVWPADARTRANARRQGARGEAYARLLAPRRRSGRRPGEAVHHPAAHRGRSPALRGLQLEGTSLDTTDLVFVNAIANQIGSRSIAIALTARHAKEQARLKARRTENARLYEQRSKPCACANRSSRSFRTI